MTTARDLYFHAVAHPMLFLAMGAPFAWLAIRVCGKHNAALVRGCAMAALAISLAVATTVIYLYAIRPDLVDHVEPHVIIRAALWLRGEPLYHDWTQPYASTTAYGPWSYLPMSGVFALLGPGFFAAKLPGLLCCAAALGLAWREHRASGRGAWAVAIQLAASALFIQAAFWTRADPLLTLGAALGVAALRVRSWGVQAAALGGLVGILINAKIHAPVYVLPLVFVVLSRAPLRGGLLAAAVALSTAALPFALPGVEIHPFLTSLGLMANQGRDAGRLLSNLNWLLFMLTPLFLLTGARPAPEPSSDITKHERLVIVGTIIAGLLTCLIAAKPGSGPWHLLPLLPWILKTTLRSSLAQTTETGATSRSALLAAWMATATLLVWTRQDGYILALWKSPATEAIAELDRVIATHPGENIQMACGTASDGPAYAITFSRVELVFRGSASDYDPSVLMDLGSVRAPIPAGLEDTLLGGGTTIFVSPAGEEPFSLKSVYDGSPVFSSEFRDRFAREFALSETGRVFQVWVKR